MISSNAVSYGLMLFPLRVAWRSRNTVRVRFGGLMLLQEGPMTIRNCLDGPGTL